VLKRLTRTALVIGCIGAACVGGRANADDAPIKMGDYFDLVAETFGLTKPPRISRREADVVIPESLLSFMRESRRLSNRRMRQELRVRLRYPLVADGLAEAAAQHRVRANTSAASKSAQAVQSYSQ